MAHEVEGNMVNEFDMNDGCYGLGQLSHVEIKIIKEYREKYVKVGDYWLTPEGRAEIRENWVDPNDGNIVLPLLNELERLEAVIKDLEQTPENPIVETGEENTNE